MNRRSFLGRVFGGFAAAVVAPYLPIPAPLPAVAPPLMAVSSTLGISMRLIQSWDVQAARRITRFDTLLGVPSPPEFVCRVQA